MSIFTRFRDIVSSNMNAMLEKAEDPEKMIKMMIHEMEDTLIELKSSCAGAIATSRKIGRHLEEAASQTKQWNDRAQLAVEKGRDDLAREALMEKRRFTETAESLERESIDHKEIIEKYHRDITELEGKLTNAKEKKRTLVERHKQAAGKKKAQQEIRRFDSSDTLTRFDKLVTRIEQMEAEADLVNFAVKPTLEREFADLATDDDIENELAKLKATKQDNG
jgi:phage shock protein A